MRKQSHLAANLGEVHSIDIPPHRGRRHKNVGNSNTIDFFILLAVFWGRVGIQMVMSHMISFCLNMSPLSNHMDVFQTELYDFHQINVWFLALVLLD